MNRILAVAVAILTLGSYAAAQQATIELNGPMTGAQKLDLSIEALRDKALRSTVSGMNDQGGESQGEEVLEYVRRQGLNTAFADQSEPARIAQSGPHGERTLYLSTKLPLYPRVLAVAIAQQAAASMYGDMQPSAERDYMEDSVVARVWIELGGRRADLPVLEPLLDYRNADLSAPIERWSANSSARHASVADQLKDQDACLSSGNYHVIPTCQDMKAKLQSDAKRYEAFHKAEMQWFMTYRPQ
jgi:hypothetical protein